MRVFLIVLTMLGSVFSLRAQTGEDSVRQVIQTLFTAMRQSDTALLRTCFSDSLVLQTIGRDKQGQTVVRTETAGSFLKSVASLPPGAADERIRFETVKLDGPLASVWTPYEFYYNGQFSHCGVNSFQLVRIRGQWKIQYLIDTRRREGCGGSGQ